MTNEISIRFISAISGIAESGTTSSYPYEPGYVLCLSCQKLICLILNELNACPMHVSHNHVHHGLG